MSYVVAQVLDGEVVLSPRAYPIERRAPPPRHQPIDRTALSYRVAYVLSKKTFWVALALGFMGGVGSLVLARRLYR